MHLLYLMIFTPTVIALSSRSMFLSRRDYMNIQIRTPAGNPPGHPGAFQIPRAGSPERGRVSMMTTGPVQVHLEKEGRRYLTAFHTTPQNLAIPVSASDRAKIKAETLIGGKAVASAQGSRIAQVDVRGPGILQNIAQPPSSPALTLSVNAGEFKSMSSVNENPQLQNVSGGAQDGGTITAEVRSGQHPRPDQLAGLGIFPQGRSP